jgi:hypothetical protein
MVLHVNCCVINVLFLCYMHFIRFDIPIEFFVDVRNIINK